MTLSKFNKKIIFCFLFPLLCSCTSVEKNYNPTKENSSYTIDCSGGLNTWEVCHNKARDICQSGYDNIGENGPHPDIIFFLNPGIGKSSVSPNLTRKLMVLCTNNGIFNQKDKLY